jgi:uncharacterized membrane protein
MPMVKPAMRVVLVLAGFVAFPFLLRAVAPEIARAVPVVIDAGLAAVFGSTLRNGAEPMIARFARAERGVLEPDLARYTRHLTRIWVMYFLAAAALMAVLWLDRRDGALEAFALFANYAGMAALFVGEWAYRRRRFAQYVHASPREMLVHVATVMRGWRR